MIHASLAVTFIFESLVTAKRSQFVSWRFIQEEGSREVIWIKFSCEISCLFDSNQLAGMILSLEHNWYWPSCNVFFDTGLVKRRGVIFFINCNDKQSINDK